MAVPYEPETGSWRDNHALDLSPILTASLELFYERGYDATSVRDIARAVKVTVPALYYHHENKESILYELLDRSIEKVADICRSARLEGKDAGQRFLNVVEAIALYEVQATKLAILDHEIRSLGAENAETYRRKRRVVEETLRESITEGVAAGLLDVSDVYFTSRAILGMLQSLAVWFKSERDGAPREVARRYVELAARTAGAIPELMERAR
jgi:AcrR family transcriptional regulator